MIPTVFVCENPVHHVLNTLTQTLVASDPSRLQHVVLTGGGAGRTITSQLAEVATHVSEQAWANTHFWWGDERFVASESPERNDFGIEASLGNFFYAPNIHRVLASDQVLSAQEAANAYSQELTGFGLAGLTPQFTLVVLGVGPDGHVASLFPGRPELSSDSITMPVFDSPKPPPIRVTMGYPTLNNSQRTLLLLGGVDKADALAATISTDGDVNVTPARGIRATELTAVTDLLVTV